VYWAPLFLFVPSAASSSPTSSALICTTVLLGTLCPHSTLRTLSSLTVHTARDDRAKNQAMCLSDPKTQLLTPASAPQCTHGEKKSFLLYTNSELLQFFFLGCMGVGTQGLAIAA
jgi:hypothetical protein